MARLGAVDGYREGRGLRRTAVSLGGRLKTGQWRAAEFLRDLETYLDFRRECDSVTLAPEEVDFEEFLVFLDVEYHLGLRGHDT
jgi:hypothetical protein